MAFLNLIFVIIFNGEHCLYLPTTCLLFFCLHHFLLISLASFIFFNHFSMFFVVCLSELSHHFLFLFCRISQIFLFFNRTTSRFQSSSFAFQLFFAFSFNFISFCRWFLKVFFGFCPNCKVSYECFLHFYLLFIEA